MEIVKLIIQAKAENIILARLATSAIGMKLDLDIDEIEDLKLCVGEACNLILEKTSIKNDDKIDIEFKMDKDIEINISAKENEFKKEKIRILSKKNKEDYALMIIQTLIDKVEYENEEKISIKMTKELE